MFIHSANMSHLSPFSQCYIIAQRNAFIIYAITFFMLGAKNTYGLLLLTGWKNEVVLLTKWNAVIVQYIDCQHAFH